MAAGVRALEGSLILVRRVERNDRGRWYDYLDIYKLTR